MVEVEGETTVPINTQLPLSRWTCGFNSIPELFFSSRRPSLFAAELWRRTTKEEEEKGPAAVGRGTLLIRVFFGGLLVGYLLIPTTYTTIITRTLPPPPPSRAFRDWPPPSSLTSTLPVVLWRDFSNWFHLITGFVSRHHFSASIDFFSCSYDSLLTRLSIDAPRSTLLRN